MLDLIEKNRNELPKIREIYNLKKELRRIGMNENVISLVDTDESAFALELVKHFLSILDSPQTIHALQKLKKIRDKSIAHNEQCTPIQVPTWLELELHKRKNSLSGFRELIGRLSITYLVSGHP